MFYLTRLKTEKRIASILRKHRWKLAIAESCTGGLVSSRMTDLSGSSEFVDANFVTYSNESKMRYLNVSEDSLSDCGAVSEKVALEMACGVMAQTASDVAIATTGIAGPTGGSELKPVGTIFVAVKIKDKSFVQKFNLNPKYSRSRMKRKFAKQALEFLLERLTDF